MNTLQTYYTKAEDLSIDVDALQLDLQNLTSIALPTEVFYLLVEHDILESDYYSNDELHFWKVLRTYKIEKLGFDSVDNMVSDAVVYIQSRANTASNLFFKAKYNQILSYYQNIQNKHEYQKLSIDNYIELTKERIAKQNSSPSYDLKVLLHLRYLQKTCSLLNYKRDEVNLIIKQVIEQHTAFQSWFVCKVIEMAYELRSQYDRAFNEKCFQLLETIFTSSYPSTYYDLIYALALKYGAFLKLPIQNWHNLMGQFFYQTALNRNRGKSDFLIPQFYAQAIHYFKLAKNDEMLDKLNGEFSKVKLENQLPTVPLPMSLEFSEKILQLELDAEKHINSLDGEGIITFLSSSKDLMPTEIETTVEDSFFHYAAVTEYDANNNFKHSKGGPIINIRKLHLEIFTVKSVAYCMKHGIESNKLNADILVKYLKKKSWLGNTDEGVKWIELLTPGIDLFFNVYGNYLSTKRIEKKEFVLPLDSLTIKIEGILRTFARLNGINTTKIESDKNKGGKKVETREMFIHELLNNDCQEFKKLFDEDEYYFFKFVFLNDGYNIRNDIAHSFYTLENYTLEKLLLVFLSILRISNHKIPQPLS